VFLLKYFGLKILRKRVVENEKNDIVINQTVNWKRAFREN